MLEVTNLPLGLVLIDFAQVDKVIISESQVALGRPWVGVGLDASSGSIWGIGVSLDIPSDESYIRLLCNGLLPKQSTQLYGTNHEWNVSGVPHSICLCGGKRVATTAIRHAVATIGAVLEFEPVRTPHYGNRIERFFNSLNEQLQCTPEMTIPGLVNFLVHYIADIYSQTSSPTLPLYADTPAAKYDSETEIVGMPAQIDPMMVEHL